VTDSKRRIGPFVLADQIGSGQNTGLFRAVREDSPSVPNVVAIRAATDPSDRHTGDRIAREHEVLRVLDSPRIPKVYSYYERDLALATTYVKGINLADVMVANNQGWVNLDPATALDIAIEAAHALRHAHSIRFGGGSRVIHGHLGPQRIRISTEGSIVVVGFGATAQGRHPAYTAPEVANGAPPTRQSDQWALGATIIEMLIGERFYTGAPNPVDAACVGDTAKWLQQLDRLYPALGPTCRTMTARNPHERFRSQPEILKALLAASRQLGGTVHRRHLVANIMVHENKLSWMRPTKPPVRNMSPPPQRDEPAVHIPPAPIESNSEPTIGEPSVSAVTIDSHIEPAPAVQELTDGGYSDRATAPLDKSPLPKMSFLPSEIAGAVFAFLLLVLGIWYLMTVL
jgi:serine/threonine protein kinase